MMGGERALAAICLDLGDTIMAETSEVKDAGGTTLRAELIPGAAEALRALKAQGYRLALVADTRPGTYQNVLRQHGLYELFDAFAISEELGCEKPAARMFEHALDTLGLRRQAHRVVMVGNNLARDIAGARRAGLLTVWTHWNERYPAVPAAEEEAPDYTIGPLGELPDLIAGIEARSAAAAAEFDAALTQRYAPAIRFDAAEPFLPVAAGFCAAAAPVPSPSFARVLRPPRGGRVLEFPVYWDWDIGHHYDLEHLWVYVGADGEVAALEGSWHGDWRRHRLGEAGERDGRGLFAYSQPGKHAFAAAPDWFTPHERFAPSCSEQAGNGGFLAPGFLADRLRKEPDWDELSSAYLRTHRFEPSWGFTKEVRLGSAVPLVAWNELREVIVRRSRAWMEALRHGREPDLPKVG